MWFYFYTTLPEALSREFRTGVPWLLLYADDLAVIADTLEECMSKLEAWKKGMENKGLIVNTNKTKLMITDSSVGSMGVYGEFSHFLSDPTEISFLVI